MDIFAGASTVSETVETVLVKNSDYYVRVMEQLTTGNSTTTATNSGTTMDSSELCQTLLHSIQRQQGASTPSAPFSVAFGNTKAPLLLLFAPAVLLRASLLLASPQADTLKPDAEWHTAVAPFLLATQSELLASPGQSVARVNTLPHPPHLHTSRHTPSWSVILTPTVLADMVPLPPSALQREHTLSADNLGGVLCVLMCGLVHFVQSLILLPQRVLCGSGTLEFCKKTMAVLLSPTVVMYGAKTRNLQIAVGSILLHIRCLLAMREAVGELRQERLIEEWSEGMQCWLDLATQTGNTVCVQLLFSYMLSPDIYWTQ
ncbi:uncharacterized protein TM35_000401540 [Trypanosoma theileri]|uniref:Uncharacterized protein n=1 Tax=Trypanosoma theileri TaxID=67003 RepID=A0A1X0NJR9_9TRYP|nr:uncharacterized protein TM35_000401540 [Trypanosoma theileri]ORC84887.1 hypothetical protein TM35_000401540 [Trypanosoma theileri]